LGFCWQIFFCHSDVLNRFKPDKVHLNQKMRLIAMTETSLQKLRPVTIEVNFPLENA